MALTQINGRLVQIDGTTITVVSNQLVATKPVLQQDTSKSIVVGGSYPFYTLGVQVSASGTSGLGFSGTGGGLQIKLIDTSFVINTSGVGLNLATNSGLVISSGVAIQLVDTSLVLASGGVGLNIATNGGLVISSGVLVRGLRIVSSDPGSPADGDTWYNSTTGSPKVTTKGLPAAVQQMLFVSATASNSVTNTTTQTAFNQNVTLPANFLTAGRGIRATGYFTYTGGTTNTLQLAFALGTTVVAGPTLTVTVADIGTVFRLEVEAVCTVAGASGNVARFRYGIINGQAPTIGANATLAINTTSSLVAQFVAIWSVANAGDTVQMNYISIEALN